MKKILIILFSILLCSCAARQDYFILGIDDYSISIGYDNVEYLRLAYNLDTKDKLNAYEEVEAAIKLLNFHLGDSVLYNPTKKEIDTNEAIIKSLTIYLKDLGSRIYSIDGIVLDKSIKTNCDKFNGQYIERNGYACLIEKQTNNVNNYIIMYGDYLNINQDELDHIEIGIK